MLWLIIRGASRRQRNLHIAALRRLRRDIPLRRFFSDWLSHDPVIGKALLRYGKTFSPELQRMRAGDPSSTKASPLLADRTLKRLRAG
jgi:hypothetical protein